MRVNRVDAGRFGAPVKTSQGFLRMPATATRIGVFDYVNPDGTRRRELRHPDDVFDAESLASLAAVPVTDEHPPEMVTAENAQRYARGWTGDAVERNGDLVDTNATITDAGLITKVETGKARELSCGYSMVADETPGVTQGIPGIPDGLAYDARQTLIRYNHLAVVPRGRAGPRARLRIDAAEQVDPDDNPHQEPQGGPMTKIKIDGVEYEVSEQAAAAMATKMRADEATITTLTATKNDLEPKVTELQGKYDSERANVVTVQAKLDAAEQKLKERNDGADVQARVDAVLKLREEAGLVLGVDYKFDGLDEPAIRTAVVAKAYPDVKLDGETPEFVAGLYRGAIAAHARTDSTGALRAAATEAQKGAGERQDAEAARLDMQKQSDEAWKRPLDATKEVK